MDRTPWIVVGTDFSEAAQHALAYAVEVASRTMARIALVHAYEDGPDPAELRLRLEVAIAHSSAARRGVHVEPVLRRGAAWDKLRNVATDLGADMLVLGPGSTARAIGSRQPVVVIPLHDTEVR
jgi:nucleotide-binding universal stress UspA family protein